MFLFLEYNLTGKLSHDSFQSRYYAASAVICAQYYRWQAVTSVFLTAMAQVILQIRIYALYRKNKPILGFMLTLFCVVSIISITLATELQTNLTVMSEFIPGIGRSCISQRQSNISFVFWIPPLFFDTFLSTLAIIKSLRIRQLLGVPAFFSSSEPLLDIFSRDSVLYFIAISATYLSCLLVWLVHGGDLLQVPTGFSAALPCVISNRMVLNIRGLRQEREAQRRSIAYGTSTSVAFQTQLAGESYLS
ncbi:hypothetical protein CPC08DRAFT_715507 [Agrocybe pediades]|nr:hypothetical protein CPC08DRAFT_715507 [Agrocybe pediades]